MSFDFTTLVTDRTQEDIATLKALKSDPDSWTDEQRTEFLEATSKGGYNYTDLNRVTAAVEYLAEYFEERGYALDYIPIEIEPGRTRWNKMDKPRKKQLDLLLRHLEKIRSALVLGDDVPVLPKEMRRLTIESANAIERVLMAVNNLIPLLEKSYWYSNEIFCGES